MLVWYEIISFSQYSFRGVSKGELRVLEPPSLNILIAKIGKMLGENRGNSLKKREKRILSTPLKQCASYASEFWKDLQAMHGHTQ